MARADELAALTAEIVACRACPRLVAWRELVAREKVARFRDETYWGRPVPGFGDPDALRLLVQLTPLYQGVDLLRSLAVGVVGPGLLVHVAYLTIMGVVGLFVVSRRLDHLLLK